jgi:parallel beta-helix repeat protein
MMRRWFLLLLLCALPLRAQAEPLVYQGEATLWKDTVWSGEVLIDGILTVAPGTTLEIRPGTTIRFTFFDSNNDGLGEHEIFIQGMLHARGTAEAPIRFTSALSSPQPGAWGAINLMASEEESELSFCVVEYAYRGFHAHFALAGLQDTEFRYNIRGTQFQESEVSFSRCRFIDNFNGLQFRDSLVRFEDLFVSGNYWGIRGVHSRVVLVGGRVTGNLVNGINLRDCDTTITAVVLDHNRKGLYLQQSRGEVGNSLFRGNSEHGIYLEESEVTITGNRLLNNGRAGIKWVASQGVLQKNRFDGGSEYALVNDTAATVAAQENWWGSSDTAAIAATVRDGADRDGVGRVDTSAFLLVPPDFSLSEIP